jgi:hypothetical protein
MKVHTEHFEPSENGKNGVIVISENEETVTNVEDWDIYVFARPNSHLRYFKEHIRQEHEDPQVIAAGDLLPLTVFPCSTQTIFVNSGSLDNAGLTENGLGIADHQFNLWKAMIEDAINTKIAQIKTKK